LPDGRYFTANLSEAGKKPVFLKPMLEAGIFKIKFAVTAKTTNAEPFKL